MELTLEEIASYVCPEESLESAHRRVLPSAKGRAREIWAEKRLEIHEWLRSILKGGDKSGVLDVSEWMSPEDLEHEDRAEDIEEELEQLVEREFRPLGARFEEDEDGIAIDFSPLSGEQKGGLGELIALGAGLLALAGLIVVSIRRPDLVS